MRSIEEEIKRFTEQLYNETFGNGQGTLDEFDWEDIATVIEETAHHFVNWQKEHQPHWKPSEQEKSALRTAIYDERHSPKVAAQLQNILKAFEGKESRKDWKPSEEQMDVLNKMTLGNFLGSGQYDILRSLYNDLKKLKRGGCSYEGY